MKRNNLVITMAVVSLLGLRLISQAQDHNLHHQKQEKQTQKAEERSKGVYSCPMHPEVTSDKPGECPKCGMTLEKKSGAQESISEMMGKPTFEQSFEGMKVQVWLMTQEEHKKMMKQHMDESSTETQTHPLNEEDLVRMMKDVDHGQKEKGMMHDSKDEKHDKIMQAMMAGTHHVMVQLLDEENRKEIGEGEVRLQFVSPSEQISTTTLTGMMQHFCGGLSLDENGTYKFLMLIEVDGKTYSAKFDYEVK